MRYPTVARHCLGIATALFAASAGAAQRAERPGEISLDSLLNTRISTASKYLQRSGDVAASVTILSADEIRQLGYSNVQELLESVPGMYVSNDRGYPYLGARGFGRPGDYNNRILVLIDGHTLNEQVWGSTPVGSDLPINLNAIERVEVVRGPGSALYGNNAMFAVINIITKTAGQLGGGIVHARFGSGAEREAGLTFGRTFSSQRSFTLSAQANRNDGPTLYFPEFQTDSATHGTVRGLDWESGGSVLGTAVAGKVSARFGYRTRNKGVPTGAFETLFGDPRLRTTDGATWIDVSSRTNVSSALQLSTRAYANRTTYSGSSPYDTAVTYLDRSNNTATGAELIATWDLASRNRLTVGGEMRWILRADYFGGDEGTEYAGGNAPSTIASVFAQNELEISPRLRIVAGLRHDDRISRWRALAPRFAVVATPDAASTIKLLYGEAFRSPSVAEGDLDAAFYVQNKSLRAERIATYELVAERRISSSTMIGMSTYHYSIQNLIEQTVNDTTIGTLFVNLNPVRGRGVELSLSVQPASAPFSVRAWYALQKTRDDSTETELSNSPNQTANAALIARSKSGLNGALQVRYESGRRMLSGMSTAAFVRADVNVGYAPSFGSRFGWLNGSDVSLRISNLANTSYSVPGGLEHLQSSLQQNGRMTFLRLRRTF